MTIIELEHKEIVNLNSTIRWMDEGIVHIKWNPDTNINISDIDELEKSFNELTGGEKVCVIQDFGRYVNMNPDARKHAAERSPDVKGIAYIITGLGQRLVLAIYVKLRKRKNPTKVFSSMEGGVAWLRSL